MVAEVHHAPEDVTVPLRKQTKAGSFLKFSDTKRFVIVASELVLALESKWGVKFAVHKIFPGSSLENFRLRLLHNSYCISPLFNL